jgi:Helix-turn-helix domain
VVARERILREEAILEGRAEGKSVRQIAKEVGVHNSTVARTGAAKGKSFVVQQPIEADPVDPRQVDIVDTIVACDRAAGDLRVRVSELVKQLAGRIGRRRRKRTPPG